MAEQAELSIYEFLSTRIVDDILDVLQLLRECVATERIWLAERLAVGSDSAPREVERDRRQPALGERSGAPPGGRLKRRSSGASVAMPT